MRKLFVELKPPGVALVVILVVWATAELAGDGTGDARHPADNPYPYHRIQEQLTREGSADTPREPERALANVEIEP